MSNLPAGFVVDAPQDGVIDNTLDVVGELAAGANRTLMWVPDTIIKAANLIPGVDMPTVSEGIEGVTGYKPGEGGYMEPGMAQQAVAAAGEVLVPGGMGLTPVKGRNLASTPQAVAEFMGMGSAKTPVAPQIAEATAEAVERGKQLPPKKLPAPLEETYKPGPVKQQPREMALKRRAGDIEAAGYKLDGGSTVKDAAQQRALKAGLDEGVVAQIAAGGPEDKAVMSQMLDILEQGRKNKTYGDFNPPRLALGDSLFSRYDAVKSTNSQAGKRVKEQVEALKGVPLDLESLNQGPLKSFAQDLKDLGVRVDRQGEVYFGGSAFEGLDGPQGIINRVIKQLNNTEATSAYDIHRMKQWIDEAVIDYDSVKPPGGLKGKADHVVGDLRKNINQYLRDMSEGYADANITYSETKDALDNVSNMIGRRNTASPESLGRAARSALSNAQKTDKTRQMLTDLDELSRKYGADHGDNLELQASFVQTLEKLFPNSKPPASLGGELSKALSAEDMRAVARGDAGGMVDAVFKGVKSAVGKSDKQKEEALIAALRELTSGP